MLMLPGSGLRAWVGHLRHWSDPAYDHRRFVQRLLRELPEGARYLVDVSYVLDFHLAGRDTTLALDIHPYFEAAGLPYDYLIVGPTGLAQRLPDRLGGRLVGVHALPGDPFACYAEVHVPRAPTPDRPPDREE